MKPAPPLRALWFEQVKPAPPLRALWFEQVKPAPPLHAEIGLNRGVVGAQGWCGFHAVGDDICRGGLGLIPRRDAPAPLNTKRHPATQRRKTRRNTARNRATRQETAQHAGGGAAWLRPPSHASRPLTHSFPVKSATASSRPARRMRTSDRNARPAAKAMPRPRTSQDSPTKIIAMAARTGTKSVNA